MQNGFSAETPDQAELGKRFRQERLRLGLTPENIAHHCGASVSSVFGWEAGRNRIPLSAAASLSLQGFDIERIIDGGGQTVRIDAYQTNDKAKKAPTMPVPAHLLKRHRLTERTSFIYHNPADGADVASPGDLLLMAWLPEDDAEVLVDRPRIVLMRPKRKGGKEALCKLSPIQKGKARLTIGSVSGIAGVAKLLDSCWVDGAYCHRLACQSLPGGISGRSHADRLADLLSMV